MPDFRRPTLLALGLLLAAVTLQAEEKPKPDATPDAAKDDSQSLVDRQKLSRKVSFEFVDTPVPEAFTFLQVLAKVGIILDPEAAKKSADRRISLRVTDMPFDEALDKLCKEAGLTWDTRGPVYISTPLRLRSSVELQIYDVRDLVGAAAAPDLAQEIRELNPTLWTDAATVIEEQGGKLVVMQRPEVHKEIQAYLEKLRAKKAKDEATGVKKDDP